MEPQEPVAALVLMISPQGDGFQWVPNPQAPIPLPLMATAFLELQQLVADQMRLWRMQQAQGRVQTADAAFAEALKRSRNGGR